MLPPLGSVTTPHNLPPIVKMRDISANYEANFTKFSAISQLDRGGGMAEKS